MRVSLLIATAFVALSAPADAYVFNQCASPQIIHNLLTGLVNAVTTLLSPANSYTGCPAYCATQNVKFSLYQPGIAGVLGTCYCTNGDPGSAFATSGTNAGGSCARTTFQINYIPSAPWAMLGCQTSPVLKGGHAPSTTPSAAQCYLTCATYAYASLTPHNNGLFTCQCGMTLAAGTATTCNNKVAVVYQSNTVAPSGIARKHMLADRAAAERATLGDCPRGFTACTVSGNDYGFECVDTRTELEACGGCVNGYYNADGDKAVGIDCATLHGVALGGASCVRGQCKVTTCRHGFHLKGSKCVRTFRIPN